MNIEEIAMLRQKGFDTTYIHHSIAQEEEQTTIIDFR